MTKKTTREERVKEFIANTQKHREEKAIEMTNEFLAMFIKQDIPVQDGHYLVARAKEILNAKMEEINFKNELIDRVRREFLSLTAKQAKDKYIKLIDEDALGNKTDERAKRMESFAQDLVGRVLSQEVLTSDQPYLEDIIEQDDQLILAATAAGYIDAFYNKLLIAISENMRRAEVKKWAKEDYEITWKDLNDVLR